MDVMTTWYSSDIHFSHKNILSYCPERPYSSVDEMNEGIVETWNSMVAPGDVVYFLGDLCMGEIKESLAFLGRLNGRSKILIAGNHDRVSHLYDKKKNDHTVDWVKVYRDHGIDLIIDGTLDHELYPGLTVRMNHFPYSGDHTTNDRFPLARPEKVDDRWLLHGHVHDLWKVNGRQINVGMGVWDMKPVSRDQIIATIEAGPSVEREFKVIKTLNIEKHFDHEVAVRGLLKDGWEIHRLRPGDVTVFRYIKEEVVS